MPARIATWPALVALLLAPILLPAAAAEEPPAAAEQPAAVTAPAPQSVTQVGAAPNGAQSESAQSESAQSKSAQSESAQSESAQPEGAASASAGATVAQGKSFDDTLASFTPESSARPQRSGPLAENNLSTTTGIVKWLLSTIAILGVIVLFAFLLKKSRLVQRTVGPMRLEAQMAVGPKERVVQLQVGQRHILLGVTSNSVNFLMELTPEAEVKAEQKTESEPAQETRQYTREEFDRFAAQFMAYMQEHKKSDAPTAATFSEVLAQAYDHTTQAAQEFEAGAASETAGSRAAGNAAELEALKHTPWVADTELVSASDQEGLPPLPQSLTQGARPDDAPPEGKSDKER